jgi:hypothetical protein
MIFGIEPPPWPMTEEDYELLVESFGSLIIDEVIDDHRRNSDIIRI